MERILISIMIILSACSGIIYALKGDVRKTLYWLAGATIMAVVTF